VSRRLEAFTAAPVIVAQLTPSGWVRAGAPSEPPPTPAVAVAALAEPELFAENARVLGARLSGLLCFPDHHAYTAADAQRILRQANGAAIVTTEKDWIKLRTLLPAERVWLLTQRVRLEHGADVLDARLDDVLRARVPESRAR
jgi:tetraacyldisaccharide 4'-kinase